MVDTRNLADVRTVAALLHQFGLREKVPLAFGGGVSLADLPGLERRDLDMVDIGRAIIDAQLLNLRHDLPLVETPA